MSYSWADMIAATIPKPKGGAHVNFGTPFLNMEITHAWDQSNEAAHTFADPLGAAVVDRYDGMVGKVDALLQAGFYEVPWQHRLAITRCTFICSLPCFGFSATMSKKSLY